MNVRKEINQLTPDELLRLREALLIMQNDDLVNSYQQTAGLHGLPNLGHCPHHLKQFLPWHRRYIQQFEQFLQSPDSSVTLPYWDWTSPVAAANGIPDAISDVSFTAADGTQKANPLHRAGVEFENRWTSRSPNTPAALNNLADRVDLAREQTVFWDPIMPTNFTSVLESAHDWLHGWVGNDMGQVAYAAYDPIFWLHHCNVDRIWAEWQKANPGVVLPTDLLNFQLAVYNIPVSETLDFEANGFTYDTISAGPPAKDPPQDRSILTVDGLEPTQDTFELRVFVNQSEEDEDISVDNPRYAGSICLLGMGGAKNPNGFKGEFGRILDIEPALRRCKGGELKEIAIRAVDEKGNSVPTDQAAPKVRYTLPTDQYTPAL